MRKDESFGQALRRQRREKELTLQDIAKVLGVSVVFVSEVERGSKPPFAPGAIERLKGILVDVAELHRSADLERNAVRLDLKGASPAHRRIATRLARQWSSMGPSQLRRLEEFFDSVEQGEEEGSSR